MQQKKEHYASSYFIPGWPAPDLPSIAFNSYVSAANGACMALHYWLAYSSAYLMPGLRPLTGGGPDGYARWWVDSTDRHTSNYLKRASFADSLADAVGSATKTFSLTKGASGPVAALNSAAGQHFGGMLGSLLEAQETPHGVALQMEDVRLLHYRGDGLPSSGIKTPLVIVYAPINRHHIMDIRKGRSVVEHFVKAGFDVFLVDWGEQQNNRPTLSDYVGYLRRSVEHVKKMTGADKVSVVGYSWGGVLSAIYASLDEGRQDVRNLVLQSAHIDFDRDGSILASWFRRLPVDEIVQKFDRVDGRFINLALLMRNPAIHFQDPWRFAASMADGGVGLWNPAQLWADAARIAAWLGDSPVLPAPLFEAFIKNLYQQNRLVLKWLEITGGRNTGGAEAARTADLQKITVPLLNIVGEYDDICTPAAALPAMDAVSSKDRQLIRFPAGHIELCVSAQAHRDLWPQVVEWLRRRDS